MKEAAPRIFRSLEKPEGTGDFDMIVAAAVSAYGSLRAPTDRQARDLGRLVVPLWKRVSPDMQRAAAASLSHAPLMPREIVELLLAAPVEVAAPFLVSSPVLCHADLDTLSARPDQRIRRIADKRRADGHFRSAPAQALAPAPERASLPFVEAPSIAADFVGEAQTSDAYERGDAAEAAREVLLRLARVGRTRPTEQAPAGSIKLLTRQASDGARPAFFETLRAMLGVDARRIAAIADDPSGASLAAALKALGAHPTDALTILMMTVPAVGLEVAVFESMSQHYRSLDAQVCRARFPQMAAPQEAGERSRSAERAEQARRQEASRREARRTEFGRRKVRPAERP